MKNRVLKKKYYILFRVLLSLVIIIATVNVIYRKYEEKVLGDEFNKIISYDLSNSTNNTSLKTHGEYKIVENAIKNYLNDYESKVTELSSLSADKKLKNILSAANYQTDGPVFNSSKLYLINLKNNYNEKLVALVKFTNKKNIESYITKENISSYSKKIYLKYMNSNSLKEKLNGNIKSLQKNGDNINNLIDSEMQVIEFLSNCTTWVIRNDKIIFSKEDDLLTYNSLISEMT